MLEAPRLGCLNVHASLLPRWRGAAPIQRAILAGDRETGVTIMRMDEGLDTGPILLAEAMPIGPATTAGELHDGLAALGARLISRRSTAWPTAASRRGRSPPRASTYAQKLGRDEARLDWRLPAASSSARCAPSTRGRASFVARMASASGCWPPSARRPAARAPGTVLDDALADRLRRRRAAPAAAAARRPRAGRDRGVPARLRAAAGTRAAMPRYKLTLEYDGTGLVGWQRQANGLSVQQIARDGGRALLRRGGHRARRRPHRCRRARAGPGARMSTCRARTRPTRSAARSTSM